MSFEENAEAFSLLKRIILVGFEENRGFLRKLAYYIKKIRVVATEFFVLFVWGKSLAIFFRNLDNFFLQVLILNPILLELVRV
jgi:hypothetical protein